jgi:hypothetical protein
MKEVEGWIKRKLPAMGSDRIMTKLPSGNAVGHRYDIKSAVLSECRLTIRQGRVQEDHRDGTVYASHPTTITQTITLKDVDISQLLVKEVFSAKTAARLHHDKQSHEIRVVALSDRGNPFLSEDEKTKGKGETKESVSTVNVRVGDQNMGNQAVDIIRRAAILCGAPS